MDFMPKPDCKRKYIGPQDPAKLNGLMIHYYDLLGSVQEDMMISAMVVAKRDAMVGVIICDGCLRRMKDTMKELDQVVDDLIKFHNENEATTPPPGLFP